MRKQPKHWYEFGPFRLDATERVLLRDAEPVPLTPKVFDTLLVLVQNQGRMLEKEELIQTLWPDSIVEEGNLSQNIFILRKALGKHPNEPQYIETIPRRGYRFVASVRAVWEEGTDRPDVAMSSIAVLPFKPLGAEGGDEYLGLGMADALITRLSNLRQIIVRPTSAVRKYTSLEQDPVAVGRKFKVESVLEGSIHRLGDRIRVTVQLVSVRDGAPLWADKFDEKLTNFDYSLGPEVEKLAKLANADALLFISGLDHISTGGRQALMFLGILLAGATGVYAGPAGGATSLSVALVDPATGAILWYNIAGSQGGHDLRDTESTADLVKQVFKDFPGRVEAK